MVQLALISVCLQLYLLLVRIKNLSSLLDTHKRASICILAFPCGILRRHSRSKVGQSRPSQQGSHPGWLFPSPYVVEKTRWQYDDQQSSRCHSGENVKNIRMTAAFYKCSFSRIFYVLRSISLKNKMMGFYKSSKFFWLQLVVVIRWLPGNYEALRYWLQPLLYLSTVRLICWYLIPSSLLRPAWHSKAY